MSEPITGLRRWGHSLLGSLRQGLDGEWLILLGVLAAYWLWWGNLSNFARAIDHCDVLFCDWIDFFYPIGRTILTRFSAPEGFYYSPFAALIFAPLAQDSLPNATLLWGFIQVAALAALYRLAVAEVVPEQSKALRPLFALMFLTSVPMLHNFKWGQVSTLVVLGILGALAAHRRGNWVVASAALALVIALKYYPAVFLVYFALKKDFKAIAVTAAVSAFLLVGLPVLVMGAVNTLAFYASTTHSLDIASRSMILDANSQYLTSLLVRVFEQNPAGAAAAGFRAVGYGLCAVNLALLDALNLRREPRVDQWGFVLLLGMVPLLTVTSWAHYFMFLPISQMFIGAIVFRQPLRAPRRIVQAVLLITSVILSSVVFLAAAGNWLNYVKMGSVLVALLLLLAVVYIECIPRLWRALRPQLLRP